MKCAHTKQQGYFLLIALVLISIMGTIGAVLMQGFVRLGNLSVSVDNGMQALYIAEAGMQVSLRQLLRSDASRLTCDALNGAAAVTNASFNTGKFTGTAAISNSSFTTLSSAIASSDTTIPVTSTTGFASSGLLVIGSEYMYYGAISGNSFTGVARGIQGTTQAAAISGSIISQHQCAVSVSAGIPNIASSTYQRILNQYLNIAYAYIANSNNNSVSICPLNANNSLNSCVKYTDATFSQPFQVLLNSTSTKAYVFNNGSNKISVCTVNTNGTLSGCSAFSDASFHFSFSGGHINNANTYLYAANFSSNTISICPMSANGSLSTCTTSTGGGTFIGPNDIVTSNTYAYILNSGNNTISICPISGSSFGSCGTSTASGTLNVSGNADLGPSNTTLYVANSGNNTLSVCPVNVNGTLGVCTTTNGNSTFKFNANYTANLFVANSNYAYISNPGNSTVSICAVNANGSLGTCTVNSDSTYSNNNSVWLSYE